MNSSDKLLVCHLRRKLEGSLVGRALAILKRLSDQELLAKYHAHKVLHQQVAVQ